MAYQNITLASLTTLSKSRVQNQGFWTQQEYTDSINWAIYFWQIGTGYWKNRVEVTTVAKRCIYDLTAINDQSGKPLLNSCLMPIRVSFNGSPMEPTSWTDLDSMGRSWQTDTTTTPGVPTAPLLWAPMGINLLAIWPSDNAGNQGLQLDVLARAPVLTNGGDFINLDSSEVSAFLDGVQNFITIKRGGAALQQTMPQFKNFLKAMGLRNSHLQAVAAFRSLMGDDFSRRVKPRRSKDIGVPLSVGYRS